MLHSPRGSNRALRWIDDQGLGRGQTRGRIRGPIQGRTPDPIQGRIPDLIPDLIRDPVHDSGGMALGMTVLSLSVPLA